MLLNSTNPCNNKEPIRAALEDGAVIGATAFCTGMLATQVFPPEPATLWITGIAALLAGLVAYARARNIQGTG